MITEITDFKLQIADCRLPTVKLRASAGGLWHLRAAAALTAIVLIFFVAGCGQKTQSLQSSADGQKACSFIRRTRAGEGHRRGSTGQGPIVRRAGAHAYDRLRRRRASRKAALWQFAGQFYDPRFPRAAAEDATTAAKSFSRLYPRADRDRQTVDRSDQRHVHRHRPNGDGNHTPSKPSRSRSKSTRLLGAKCSCRWAICAVGRSARSVPPEIAVGWLIAAICAHSGGCSPGGSVRR